MSERSKHQHTWGPWITVAPFGKNTYRTCPCGLSQFTEAHR